jgi:hypothetical protein
VEKNQNDNEQAGCSSLLHAQAFELEKDNEHNLSSSFIASKKTKKGMITSSATILRHSFSWKRTKMIMNTTIAH